MLSRSLPLFLSLSLWGRSFLSPPPTWQTNWSHRKDAINYRSTIPLHIKTPHPTPTLNPYGCHPLWHSQWEIMTEKNTSSFIFYLALRWEIQTLWVPHNIIVLALRRAAKWIVFENEPGFAINYTTGFWAIVILFETEADWINALIYVELQVHLLQ